MQLVDSDWAMGWTIRISTNDKVQIFLF